MLWGRFAPWLKRRRSWRASADLARGRGWTSGCSPPPWCGWFRPAPLAWRRLGDAAWVAREDAALYALAALATAADALAGLEPLASSETVRTDLANAVADTVLEALPPDRLLRLAVAASTGAAASARMEIYPRGMSARRALRLSLHVLVSLELPEGVVRDRVGSRYPAALALPARPALDELMAEHEWSFNAQTQTYLRPGLAHTTSSGTVQALNRLSSALPHQRRARDPEALEAQAFQDALDRGVESGRFRVVQVRADRAEEATVSLGAELGVVPISLDHLVWDALQAKARELNVPDPAVILEADREGPEGPEWQRLRSLVELAAQDVVEGLLAERAETALLVHPGVLARFDLRDALFELAERAQNEEGAAVVLLVPSHDDGLAPSINHQLPVPTVAGGQRLRLPESWIENKHRAPASALAL